MGDAADPAQGGVSDARWQRTLGRIETVYGRLDDGQRLWLRDRLTRSAFDPQRVSAERQARIADARAAVVRIQGGAAPADEWRRWWAQVAQSPRPDYRAYSQMALQDLCVQWADLHNRTTPAQRQHAANKLQSFEREALALAGRASR
jgi:hypothetical protein